MVEPNQGSGVMWRYAVLRGEMLTKMLTTPPGPPVPE
jgi:hypothetical protein